MKKAKWISILVVALTAVGGTVVWHQRVQIEQLKADAVSTKTLAQENERRRAADASQGDLSSMATLQIFIPNGSRQSEDIWWVHLNNEVIASHDDGSIQHTSTDLFVEDNEDGTLLAHNPHNFSENYFIVNGVVKSFHGSREWFEQNFSSAKLPLKPGSYDLTIVHPGRGDCLTANTLHFDLAAGETKTVHFGAQPVRGPESLRALPSDFYDADKFGSELIFAANSLEDVSRKFAADQRVVALKQALSQGANGGSTLYLAMPDSCGGARYYNAAEIDFVVAGLVSEFKMYLPKLRSPLTESQQEAYQQYATSVARFNLQVEQLRAVSTAIAGPNAPR